MQKNHISWSALVLLMHAKLILSAFIRLNSISLNDSESWNFIMNKRVKLCLNIISIFLV